MKSQSGTCKICGGGTVNKFNINLQMVAICEKCANAITKQQIDYLTTQEK